MSRNTLKIVSEEITSVCEVYMRFTDKLFRPSNLPILFANVYLFKPRDVRLQDAISSLFMDATLLRN